MRPAIIAAFPPALATRISELTDGSEVDPDEEIEGPSPSDGGLAVNGWQLFAHPLLLDQLER